MKYAIQHNQEQQRFELELENLLCVIDYELNGKNLSLPHVGVPRPLEGRGIASELTRAALDWARAENYRVIPVCPYVQTWLRRHPEYQNLIS
ncbi:MAG: GNAT family N-acetyltransferase [Methylococcales bacterium]